MWHCGFHLYVSWCFSLYGGIMCLFGNWNFVLTSSLCNWFQGKCTTAEALCGHDSHSHFRRSASSLRSHCGHHSLIPCRPIPCGLGACCYHYMITAVFIICSFERNLNSRFLSSLFMLPCINETVVAEGRWHFQSCSIWWCQEVIFWVKAGWMLLG